MTNPRLFRTVLQRCIIGLGCGLVALPARADAPEPIRVLAQVPPKTYYVGQAIELRIGAEAEGDRPEVIPPSIPDVSVARIDSSLSPLAASGIGSTVAERNLFITRFRLIPRRAGVLRIPPVRVRLGERSGASPPLRIDVRGLPVGGRPPDFLGGVGAFAVEAEASPSTVRTGQALTYTIEVTGPAARGMTAAPSLGRLARLPLGLEVEPMPTEAGDSPPSRRFRYRIRPTRAGRASLPPVAIAAFDPQAARYVTKVTSSVPIRVVEVPKFDPATLDYAPPPTPAAPRPIPVPRGRTAAVLALSIVGGLALGLAARAFLGRKRTDPGRLLLRRAQGLDPGQGAERTARLITEGLAEYLERASGRPHGALTPEEARAGIVEATRHDDLGMRCARLVADCDRARYSDRGPCTAALVAEARRLFEEIGRKDHVARESGRGKRGGESGRKA